MRLHQIRNSTIIINYAHKRFLINPMLGAIKNNNHYLPLPIPPKDIVKNIDAVIITNFCSDNFDNIAEKFLPKDIKIFVQNKTAKEILAKVHFKNIEIISSDGTDFDSIKLYKTKHRQDNMGIIFDAEDEPKLYHTGNIIWSEDVKETLDVYKPNCIIVNTSGKQNKISESIAVGINDIKKLHEYYPQAKLLASSANSVDRPIFGRTEIRKSEVKNYIYTPADGEIMFVV